MVVVVVIYIGISGVADLWRPFTIKIKCAYLTIGVMYDTVGMVAMITQTLV